MNFKQIYLTHRTVTGSITPIQSRPESNGNEGVFHTPRFTEQESHHQMQFREHPFVGGSYSFAGDIVSLFQLRRLGYRLDKDSVLLT